eukprot:GEMP01026475.1.p1 GENE.GEMP01026475.1~~GEMP01026475.1.p1  ORF type:complete len:357 (+),score=24.38 GEMP01026475.1:25-1071(+)
MMQFSALITLIAQIAATDVDDGRQYLSNSAQLNLPQTEEAKDKVHRTRQRLLIPQGCHSAQLQLSMLTLSLKDQHSLLSSENPDSRKNFFGNLPCSVTTDHDEIIRELLRPLYNAELQDGTGTSRFRALINGLFHGYNDHKMSISGSNEIRQQLGTKYNQLIYEPLRQVVLERKKLLDQATDLQWMLLELPAEKSSVLLVDSTNKQVRSQQEVLWKTELHKKWASGPTYHKFVHSLLQLPSEKKGFLGSVTDTLNTVNNLVDKLMTPDAQTQLARELAQTLEITPLPWGLVAAVRLRQLWSLTQFTPKIQRCLLNSNNCPDIPQPDAENLLTNLLLPCGGRRRLQGGG